MESVTYLQQKRIHKVGIISIVISTFLFWVLFNIFPTCIIQSGWTLLIAAFLVFIPTTLLVNHFVVIESFRYNTDRDALEKTSVEKVTVHNKEEERLSKETLKKKKRKF
jgi:hypothetical protein